MGSKVTRRLWVAAFLTSVGVAAVLVSELNGVSLVPASYANLVDRSPVTKVILMLFAVSLAINARNTLAVFGEFAKVHRGLRSDPSSGQLRLVGEGLLGKHAGRLYQIYGLAFEGEVSQAVSLGVIRSRLYRNEWFVRSASQFLLTLGLIGTVVGLGQSLDGICVTIRSMAAANAGELPASPETSDRASGGLFTEGLHAAVGGMATAFATTMFGAVLGGIFLKLLSNCTQDLAEDLVDDIEIRSETELVPLLRAPRGEVNARRRELLAFMDQAVAKETDRLQAIASRIEAITEKFNALAAAIASAIAAIVVQ